MGLLFNLDTDTVKGPSESLYCRIDQITIQKDANRIIVSLIYFKDIEKNITPANRKKTVFVKNMIPSKESKNIQGKNQTQFIMIGKSLNSIIKENILLDAAYT